MYLDLLYILLFRDSWGKCIKAPMVNIKHLSAPIAFLISLLALVYAFWWGLDDLVKAWGADEYGHSYFLPFLALLVGLHVLAKQPSEPRPSWAGPVAMVIAVSFLFVGELAAFRQMTHYGFYIGLIALALTYLGTRITVRLLPAWGLLFFAIPLLPQIEGLLSLQLKLYSSDLGAIFLNLVGISVFQDGNVIDLGIYKLQVVDACSGLRYLFPLMGFSFLIAYMLKAAMWKRVVVFLSTIPITLLLNALRIAVIGVTVAWRGPKMAEGLIHDLEGWVVFILCLLLLWGVVALFIKTGENDSFDFDVLSIPRGPFLTVAPCFSGAALTVLLLCLLAAGAEGAGLFKPSRQDVSDSQVLTRFPMSIGTWKGKAQSLEANVLESLALTEYVSANYSSPEEPQTVGLYIAYYATQEMGATIHSPTTCLPGSGWEMDDTREVVIPVEGQGQLPVVRMVVRKGMDRLLVYYWFNQGGRNLSNRIDVKKNLVIDALLRKRSDGALIRLTSPLAENETAEQAEGRLQKFLAVAFPTIRDALPKE